MAWPGLAFPGPMHQVTLTRDSVRLADDVDAPHRGMVAVPATMDVPSIAEALLRSPWPAHVGSNATWWCSIGPVTLIFGLSAGNPFVQRIGDGAFLTTVVTNLHVHYSAQRDRDEICRDIAEYGAAAVPRNGTSLPPGD